PRARMPAAPPLAAAPARPPPSTLPRPPRCTVTNLHRLILPQPLAQYPARARGAATRDSHQADAVADPDHLSHCSQYALFRTAPPAGKPASANALCGALASIVRARSLAVLASSN